MDETKCTACRMFPRVEGSNHCESCKAVIEFYWKDIFKKATDDN